MKLLINTSNLIVGGGIQVGAAIINSLKNYPQHTYYAVCSKQVIENLTAKNFPDFVKIIQYPELPKWKKSLWQLLRINPVLGKYEKDFSVDTVITPLGPSYWRPQSPHVCGFAQAYVVYEESEYVKNLKITTKLKLALIKRSFMKDVDSYVVESNDTATRLRKLVSNHDVHVVYNTCNPVFVNPESQEEFLLPEFSGTTLLTISANYPHKNLSIIKSVAEWLQKKYSDLKFRFVVTLNPEDFGYNCERCPDWLLPIGKVKINQCPSLYRQASIMFLPTLLECFSASWAEAMVMGVPTLTSDLPFAHSICEDAAMYIDPYNAEKIADAIYQLVVDKNLRNNIINRGYEVCKKFENASERTGKYIKIAEDLVNSRKNFE